MKDKSVQTENNWRNSLIFKKLKKKKNNKCVFNVMCSCYEEMGLLFSLDPRNIVEYRVFASFFVIFCSYKLDICCSCKVLIFKNVVYFHVI